MKHILCIVCLVCFFCVSLAAEEPVESAAADKTPELTELEQLTLQNLLKDFTIAQLQRQVAQRNEAAALATFWAQVNRLRAEKNAPEAEFIFNPQTMSFESKFVLNPQTPSSEPKPKPAAADKPESPEADR